MGSSPLLAMGAHRETLDLIQVSVLKAIESYAKYLTFSPGNK